MKIAEAEFADLYTHLHTVEKILSLTGPALYERHRKVIAHYEKVLRRLGLLEAAMEIREEDLRRLFYLTHSSFEYALNRLSGEGAERDLLRAHLESYVSSWLQAPEVPKHPVPIYDVTAPDVDLQCFPNPVSFRELKNQESSNQRRFLASTRSWIEKWNPAILPEIDLWIHAYVIPYSRFGVYYLSSDEEPGFVLISPQMLLSKEGFTYEPGSPIETILAAGQLIHESRHQKGFYFDRVSDPQPGLAPCRFVKKESYHIPLPHPFGHLDLKHLFDVILSLGWEFSYLRWIRTEGQVPRGYEEAFEKKFARKKMYFYGAVMAGESYREELTALGTIVLKEMLERFQK